LAKKRDPASPSPATKGGYWSGFVWGLETNTVHRLRHRLLRVGGEGRRRCAKQPATRCPHRRACSLGPYCPCAWHSWWCTCIGAWLRRQSRAVAQPPATAPRRALHPQGTAPLHEGRARLQDSGVAAACGAADGGQAQRHQRRGAGFGHHLGVDPVGVKLHRFLATRLGEATVRSVVVARQAVGLDPCARRQAAHRLEQHGRRERIGRASSCRHAVSRGQDG
jgi:hypothetical protein